MKWLHVPTAVNPADIILRGSSASELANSKLWHYGPEFLQLEPNEWPKLPNLLNDLPKKKKTSSKTALLATISCNFKFINSFSKIQRIFAYVARFYSIVADRTRRVGPLSVNEINLGIVQMATFKVEYSNLLKNKRVSSNSKLYSLDPFMNSFGLIRVGGRIQKSSLSFQSKKASHHFTQTSSFYRWFDSTFSFKESSLWPSVFACINKITILANLWPDRSSPCC